MSAATLQEQWQETLDDRIRELRALGLQDFTGVTVLEETESTQDAAVGEEIGHIVTALRQIGGRGRQGRKWSDDRGEGVAATFVVPADHSGRLGIAAALAAAEAVGALIPSTRSIGIKWPNDVLIDRRKVAGILVEQDHRTARIGIGINVHQRSWPPDLADSAVSLAQAGAEVDRLDLLVVLLATLACMLQEDEQALEQQFGMLDVLLGSQVELAHRGSVQKGRVIDIRPFESIDFESEGGRRICIPVAEVTIVSVLEWPESVTERN